MKLTFTKMQGCGNDYIYVDCRTTPVAQNISEMAIELSKRHLSVGADGIICICSPETDGADAFMRIFNADGSEGKMCGNGIRCVAQWLREHVLSCAQKNVLLIDSKTGTKQVRHCGENMWQVDMGNYSTLAKDIPARFLGEGNLVDVALYAAEKEWQVTCVSTGNPHCITVVKDVAILKLEEIGPRFEKHSAFPERINTEFVEVYSSTYLKMRVWERGSGETYACGTGACATVAAMVEQGICEKGQDVHVKLIGGELIIRIEQNGEIKMTGPAYTVYEGVIDNER